MPRVIADHAKEADVKIDGTEFGSITISGKTYEYCRVFRCA